MSGAGGTTFASLRRFRLGFACYMDPRAASLRECVRRALSEDLGSASLDVTQDVTSRLSVPAGRRGRARLLAKSAGVIAGLACAVELAEDRERLSALRAGLRSRMEASPLMDGRRYIRALEQQLVAALGY